MSRIQLHLHTSTELGDTPPPTDTPPGQTPPQADTPQADTLRAVNPWSSL